MDGFFLMLNPKMIATVVKTLKSFEKSLGRVNLPEPPPCAPMSGVENLFPRNSFSTFADDFYKLLYTIRH